MAQKRQGSGKQQGGPSRSGGQQGQQAGGPRQQGGGDDLHSLKAREYRDPDGTVHHHTKSYMEQHHGQRRGGSGRGR